MRRNLSPILGLVLLTKPVAAAGEDGSGPPRLGQSPGEPQTRSAAPSLPFGISPTTSKDNALDFHGYLMVPLRVGLMRREAVKEDQSKYVLHTPPLTPEYVRSFSYTGAIPDPWIQLNFTYGNSTVSGTAIIAAKSATDGTGFYNPVEQLGVYDAFVTVNLTKPLKTPIELKVGAITGRYGAMGAYDAGHYGTPLIARTNTVGETITASLKLGRLHLVIEQGLGGQLSRPAYGMVPAAWNDYAPTDVGSSLVSQLHAGAVYQDTLHLGLHYLTAFSMDDQIPEGTVSDGHITVVAADARFTAGQFGHLYAGVAQTMATNARRVSGVIEILNARGGHELMEQYLGEGTEANPADGDGSLTTFGTQYDVSVARLLYGNLFTGTSPDVGVSLFGIGAKVKSYEGTQEDGTFKLKLGGQATYSVASWLAFSGRFDHVRLDGSDNTRAYNIVSPRVLFHTDWQSRDEIALQFSHFMYGSRVLVRRGSPPVEDPTAIPDRNVVTLSGTFWW
jgi:hypothetical protein